MCFETDIEIDMICLKFKVTGLCLLKYKMYSCFMKEETGTENLSDLPTVTELARGRVGIQN